MEDAFEIATRKQDEADTAHLAALEIQADPNATEAEKDAAIQRATDLAEEAEDLMNGA